jgi:aldehyde dehydrogenase (NAD+)
MNKNILSELGINDLEKKGVLPSLFIGEDVSYGKSDVFYSKTPINSKKSSFFRQVKKSKLEKTISILKDEFNLWQEVPAPKRGELVRTFATLVREEKEKLAYLITLESGKIFEEALGEVQEVIDVCDFAVGLSRQLYGLTIASERYRHKMVEQWHPLGVVGIISAFNFPMAVWAWNAMLALVCGNTLIWKPSSQTPLCAIACHLLLQKALKSYPSFPQNISSVIIANRNLSEKIVTSKDIRLVSATGSVSMGKILAPKVTSRLGRVLLELGGNNAMIVTKSAQLDLALRAVLFSAVGTAGQRCTSLRRLFIHKDIFEKFSSSLQKAYESVSIGDPFSKETLMGPLINKGSYTNMQKVLKKVKKQNGEILYGGTRVKKDVPKKGYYVEPALVKIKHSAKIVQNETFAPILYLIEYEDFNEVVKLHNSVPQGLSSAIFTQDLKEAEIFMSSIGSDCGIANVNIGTSGAEIGGAFGGEKDTGGGRESGSDSWKNYMRRATNTINYSDDMPLSQGINFEKN